MERMNRRDLGNAGSNRELGVGRKEETRMKDEGVSLEVFALFVF